MNGDNGISRGVIASIAEEEEGQTTSKWGEEPSPSNRTYLDPTCPTSYQITRHRPASLPFQPNTQFQVLLSSSYSPWGGASHHHHPPASHATLRHSTAFHPRHSPHHHHHPGRNSPITRAFRKICSRTTKTHAQWRGGDGKKEESESTARKEKPDRPTTRRIDELIIRPDGGGSERRRRAAENPAGGWRRRRRREAR